MSENLSTEYRGTLLFRFPILKNASKQINKGPYPTTLDAEELRTVPAGIAEVTFMELDKNFKPTGKTFIYDLSSTANNSYSIIYDNKADDFNVMNYWYRFNKHVVLNGDYSITNLESPYVQIRLSADLTSSSQNTKTVVLNTIVDLSASDTVVFNFLSDYKAARVKNLLSKGKISFEKAQKQANNELAAFFGLGEDEKPFEANTMANPSAAEYLAENLWVSVLFNNPNFNDRPEFAYSTQWYETFKKAFAESGNFSEPQTVTLNDYRVERNSSDPYFQDILLEVKALMIDVMLNLELRESRIDAYGLSNASDLDESILSFDFIQKNLIKEYKLPEVGNSKMIYLGNDGNGYYRYFLWSTSTSGGLWNVVFRGGEPYAHQVQSEMKAGLYGIPSCDEANNGRVIKFPVRGSEDIARDYSYIDEDKNVPYVCDGSSWKIDERVECHESGEYVAGYTASGRRYDYYRCAENGDGELEERLVSNYEYILKTPCTSALQDSLKTIELRNGEYMKTEYLVCSNGEWERLEYVYDPVEIANYKFGKTCTNGETRNVTSAEQLRNSTVICDGGSWRQIRSYEAELGMCNEERMKNDPLATSKGQLKKCNNLLRSYDSKYYWVTAYNLDTNETIKACTYDRLNIVEKVGDSYYKCDYVSENVDGISYMSTKWSRASDYEYAAYNLTYKVAKCDEDLMYEQEKPTPFNGKYYKCDGITNSYYRWVEADMDQKLGLLCLYDRSTTGRWIYPDTVDGNKFDYYLCTFKTALGSEWVKLNSSEYCDLQGENLELNGIKVSNKFICKYNDEYYYKDASNNNASWISVNEYCGKPNGTSTAPTNAHAVKNSCAFPISDEVAYDSKGNKLTDWAENTLYKSYDNSVYFTYTEVEKGEYGWDFTALVKFYCQARTGFGSNQSSDGKKCWFENTLYTYNWNKSRWE